MKKIKENTKPPGTNRHFPRRRFLQLLLLSGAAAGCQRFAPSTPEDVPATSSATLTLDLRFGLENAAVTYGPHPRGCDVTSIRGSVRAADGSPVVGIAVRVWADDVSQAVMLSTDSTGHYSCDVAASLSSDTFHVQLIDPAATALLSDVVVAQAVSSCNLNLMTVNFVATR